jgi:hypothetical protein
MAGRDVPLAGRGEAGNAHHSMGLCGCKSRRS